MKKMTFKELIEKEGEVTNPIKLKKERWKELQFEYMEQHGLKLKRGQPIQPKFFEHLLEEYKKGNNKRDLIELFTYMIDSTINGYKYGQTNYAQKQRFKSQAFYNLIKVGIPNFDPALGSIFSYFLTIIQRSCDAVIVTEQKEKDALNAYVKSIISENIEMLNIEKLRVGAFKHLVNMKSIDIEEQQMLSDFFENREELTDMFYAKLKSMSDVDITHLKDVSITLNKDMMVYQREKRIFGSIFYILDEKRAVEVFKSIRKFDEKKQKQYLNMYDLNNKIIPYDKTETKIVKELLIKLEIYKPLLILDVLSKRVHNENNGTVKTSLMKQSLYSRIIAKDTQYFMCYIEDIKDNTFDEYIEHLIKFTKDGTEWQKGNLTKGVFRLERLEKETSIKLIDRYKEITDISYEILDVDKNYKSLGIYSSSDVTPYLKASNKKNVTRCFDCGVIQEDLS